TMPEACGGTVNDPPSVSMPARRSIWGSSCCHFKGIFRLSGSASPLVNMAGNNFSRPPAASPICPVASAHAPSRTYLASSADIVHDVTVELFQLLSISSKSTAAEFLFSNQKSYCPGKYSSKSPAVGGSQVTILTGKLNASAGASGVWISLAPPFLGV